MENDGTLLSVPGATDSVPTVPVAAAAEPNSHDGIKRDRPEGADEAAGEENESKKQKTTDGAGSEGQAPGEGNENNKLKRTSSGDDKSGHSSEDENNKNKGRFSSGEKRMLFGLIRSDPGLFNAFLHQRKERMYGTKSWMHEISSRFNAAATEKRSLEAIRHHLMFRKSTSGRNGKSDANMSAHLLQEHASVCHQSETCTKCLIFQRLCVQSGWAKCGYEKCFECAPHLPDVSSMISGKDRSSLLKLSTSSAASPGTGALDLSSAAEINAMRMRNAASVLGFPPERAAEFGALDVNVQAMLLAQKQSAMVALAGLHNPANAGLSLLLMQSLMSPQQQATLLQQKAELFQRLQQQQQQQAGGDADPEAQAAALAKILAAQNEQRENAGLANYLPRGLGQPRLYDLL